MIDWTKIKPRKAVKNPFQRGGFDSFVSKNTTFNGAGALIIGANETFIFDGNFVGIGITQEGDGSPNKTTLVVGGHMRVETITVSNITITGRIDCDVIIVEGQLSIKGDATLKAREIRYRALTIEDGAVVIGQMNHLDYISAGEQT